MATGKADPYRRMWAERSEAGRRDRHADHGKRPAAMLVAERSRLVHVEARGRDIGRIAEPQADVERAGGRQTNGGVESEELIEHDGADTRTQHAVFIDFEIALVPGKTEMAERRIDRAVGEQLAMLDR